MRHQRKTDFVLEVVDLAANARLPNTRKTSIVISSIIVLSGALSPLGNLGTGVPLHQIV